MTPQRPNLAIHVRWTLPTPAQMTWLSGLEVHMELVTLRSVTIGVALLLICCGDPEAKARRLLNQAQVLKREGKEAA